MKVAIVHNLPSGGAKRHTREQVRELAQRGHELVEFAPSTADVGFCDLRPYVSATHVFDAGPTPVMQTRIPFVTPYVHAVQGLGILRQARRVNRLMAEAVDAGGFDVALVKDCHLIMNPYVLSFLRTPRIFHCHHGLRHYSGSAAQFAGNGSSAMASLRTLYYWPAHKLYDAAFASDERANLLNASMVLTNSRFTRGLLADRYGVDAQVVYPGIDTDTFRPTSRRIGHYVLCVGALIYGKGYRFLISAIGRIPPARRPMLFIVADSLDPTEAVEVQRMAAVAGVGLRIERIQNDAHLANVYTEAAAFVYAPIAEPLGLAPLEAMACGTPVVAVRDGGVCETVRDGETGWLVERDPSEFAERLDRLLCNRAERTRMSRAGVEYVRREWTWSSAVARLEDAFQAVAG